MFNLSVRSLKTNLLNPKQRNKEVNDYLWCMGFFSDIVSAAVKVALTPVAVVKDVVDTTQGLEPDNTKNLIESSGDDLANSIDDLADGEVI